MLHLRILKEGKSLELGNLCSEMEIRLICMCLSVSINPLSLTCTFHSICHNNTALRGLGYLFTQALLYALKMHTVNTRETTDHQTKSAPRCASAAPA